MRDTLIPAGIAIVLLAAVIGGYFFPKSSIVEIAGSSPQGSTFSSAKFAGVAVNLAAPGANATSSSVLNTSGQDVYITDLKIGCEGVGTSKTAYTGAGLASLTVKVSTSSTAAPAAVSSTLINGATFTLSTSTPFFTLASSTVGTVGTGSSNWQLIWSAGSYLTFQTNATNTAQCTFGANYISS